MKQFSAVLAMVAVAALAAVPEARGTQQTQSALGLGVDVSNVDPAVRPQDDFFQYDGRGDAAHRYHAILLDIDHSPESWLHASHGITQQFCNWLQFMLLHHFFRHHHYKRGTI